MDQAIVIVVIIVIIIIIAVILVNPAQPVKNSTSLSSAVISDAPASQSVLVAIAPPPSLYNRNVALVSGRSGKLCAHEDNNKLNCNRDAVGPWETFYAQDLGGGKIGLKSTKNNKYCIDAPGGIECTDGAVGDWSQFLLADIGNGQVSLRGNNGQKLCADEAGNIICNRDAVGDWEKFTLRNI